MTDVESFKPTGTYRDPATGQTVVATDDDPGCRQAVWEEISWLADFQSPRAKHLFTLFHAGYYGQALAYYARSKF